MSSFNPRAIKEILKLKKDDFLHLFQNESSYKVSLTRLSNYISKSLNFKTINGESLKGTGNLEVITDVSDKQDILVSGTNIKTINNNSLLGSGNLSLASVNLGTGDLVQSDTIRTYSLAGGKQLAFLRDLNYITSPIHSMQEGRSSLHEMYQVIEDGNNTSVLDLINTGEGSPTGYQRCSSELASGPSTNKIGGITTLSGTASTATGKQVISSAETINEVIGYLAQLSGINPATTGISTSLNTEGDSVRGSNHNILGTERTDAYGTDSSITANFKAIVGGPFDGQPGGIAIGTRNSIFSTASIVKGVKSLLTGGATNAQIGSEQKITGDTLLTGSNYIYGVNTEITGSSPKIIGHRIELDPSNTGVGRTFFQLIDANDATPIHKELTARNNNGDVHWSTINDLPIVSSLDNADTVKVWSVSEQAHRKVPVGDLSGSSNLVATTPVDNTDDSNNWTANTYYTKTITITGAVVGDPVVLTLPEEILNVYETAGVGPGYHSAVVTAVDTVKIRSRPGGFLDFDTLTSPEYAIAVIK